MPKQRSFAEGLVADTISGLIGSELLQNPKAIHIAVVVLRQYVVSLERRGFATKNEVEKCFDLISIMERDL